MNHGLRFTAAKIAGRLKLIRPFVHRHSVPLPPFHLCELDSAAEEPPLGADAGAWPEIPHDSYWGRADLNFLMSTQLTISKGWSGRNLALHLSLGTFGDIFNHPEALVLIDGQPVGSVDRYHHTVAIDGALADGNTHRLDLHGWTGHTQWPPDPASRAKLFMGRPALVQREPILLEFTRLAETALDTCNVLDPDAPERDALFDALDAAFLALDTRAPLGEALYATAPTALATLQDGIAQAGPPLDTSLHAIGHAHMDIAYLWPIDQIRRKNARTYSNVLRLMAADPDYRFSHSQPQLYAYCERDYPQIFEGLKARVAEGRWEVMGGMWVEPDLNIPGPESLVRQLILGRQYFKDAFGDVETPVLWLPDTFGFPGQIPQLMAQAGLKWFCTNKLNWNQVTRVPPTHNWQGIDGTRVLAHVLTTPRDVEYLPFPTNYKSDLAAREVLGTVTRADNDAMNLPICYGYGDGGGGPTEDLLARAHTFAAMPGLPRMRFSTVRETFEAIESEARDLPVHYGEHYMEGHRGVFTSQAWIKRANRTNERALHEAEALSVMAGIVPDLEEAWKLLCLNQFHDIITGTSVPVVFDEARRDHAKIAEMAEIASVMAAKRLAAGATETVVLNTAPVPTDRVIEVPSGITNDQPGQHSSEMDLVFAPNIAPYSHSVISELASDPPSGLEVSVDDTGGRLENQFVRVRVDNFGRLTSIYDKTGGGEFLSPVKLGNQFQAFEDRPICWDAWDIDPGFTDRMDLIEVPAKLTITESGPVRAAIKLGFHWRESRFSQEIRLCAHTSRIDFVTQVDWHQTHTLLKVAFPVDIQSDHALFDIQWGAIQRSTSRATPTDFAKFEVAAQKWAMLSDDRRSFALLNNCKYGHDVTGNVMRLTLIKSSTTPDPNADQGMHVFTYAVQPFQGNDRACVDAAAYDLNTPTRLVFSEDGKSQENASPIAFEALGKRVIPESLVPESEGVFLIRIFEPDGEVGVFELDFSIPIDRAELCNLTGDLLAELQVSGTKLCHEISQFQIQTLRIFA